MYILVVDQDRVTRDLAAEVIECLGYRALEAATADEALQIAGQTSEALTLLVTAVMLPRISGLELSARLRAWYPDLKVIYMSGTRDPVRIYGAIHPGSAPLMKPFTKEQLGYELGALLHVHADQVHQA